MELQHGGESHGGLVSHLPFQSHGQLPHCTTHSSGVENTGAKRGYCCPESHSKSAEKLGAEPRRLLLGQELFQTPFLATFPRCECQHTQDAVSAEVEQLLREGSGALDSKLWDL